RRKYSHVAASLRRRRREPRFSSTVPGRFERPTCGSEDRCSIQLSYGTRPGNGPGRPDHSVTPGRRAEGYTRGALSQSTEARTLKMGKSGTAPSRVGRLGRGAQVPRRYWVIPLAVAALIGAVGIVGYRVIRESFRTQLRNEIQTLLDADKEALSGWVDAK